MILKLVLRAQLTGSLSYSPGSSKPAMSSSSPLFTRIQWRFPYPTRDLLPLEDQELLAQSQPTLS